MSSRLAPSRGIILSAVLGAIFWGCVGVALSAEQTIHCPHPSATPGQTVSECLGDPLEGWADTINMADVEATSLIPWCSGADPGTGSCPGLSGTSVWRMASDFEEGDRVYVGDMADGSYEYFESLTEWPLTGSPGGGDGDEFGLDDLDMEEVLKAFSAGFFLVAMFWGFGKGIGLILQQVRR